MFSSLDTDIIRTNRKVQMLATLILFSPTHPYFREVSYDLKTSCLKYLKGALGCTISI